MQALTSDELLHFKAGSLVYGYQHLGRNCCLHMKAEDGGSRLI